MPISFTNACFLRGAHTLGQCMPDNGREVAIVGSSNAGKSSALNVITGVNGLARTSKQPGCTRQINYFELGNKQYLVDLPGYGFARAPPALRRHWEQTLSAYFETRENLAGLMVIIDIRRILKDLDRQLIAWVVGMGIPIHCLLSKADKLSKGAAISARRQSRAQLALIAPEAGVQLFSAPDRRGVDEARARIRAWLEK